MTDEIIDLRSVNWSHGMFLTPEHFLRQERYFDSVLLWLVRYALRNTGLLGGGPRIETSELGAPRLDPIVDVDDAGDSLNVTVSQCRGITRGGVLVEVDPGRALNDSFSKQELEGTQDLGVYVVARPHLKEADGGVEDSVNPQIPAARRFAYTIQLDVTAEEAQWALLLSRLRRAEKGLGFEKVPGFIPPCSFMSSHSELMHSFRQLNEQVSALADRFGTLHRAIVDFVAVAQSRGINVDQDNETLSFVSRMVLALEECAYEILDPLQSPQYFFQQLTRLIRSSALFLSLSPPTREYFRLLGEIGEAEFVSMLEQEGETLEMERRWSIHEDLSIEVRKVLRSLDRLLRLEQALEGKYMDFRVSPSLESLNFVFDRTGGEPVLYKTVAKPARPQAHGQDVTFVFAPLKLEAREVYRLILVGDRQAEFVPGDQLTIEVRINPGEGYNRAPEYLNSDYEIDGHRNFAFDFKAPEDIVSINDLRVSLRSTHPVRSAILYARSRLRTSLDAGAAGSRLSASPSSRAVPGSRVSKPAAPAPPARPAPPAAPSPPAAESRTGRRGRLQEIREDSDDDDSSSSSKKRLS